MTPLLATWHANDVAMQRLAARGIALHAAERTLPLAALRRLADRFTDPEARAAALEGITARLPAQEEST